MNCVKCYQIGDDHHGPHRDDEGHEWPKLPDAARKALAVLRDVGFVDPNFKGKVCAMCKRDGEHSPGCTLAEAIRDLEAAL